MDNEFFTDGGQSAMPWEWICLLQSEERIEGLSALGEFRNVKRAEESEMQVPTQPQTINESSNATTALCLNDWGEFTELRSSGSYGDPPMFLSSLHETFSATAVLPSLYSSTYTWLLEPSHWSEPAQLFIEDSEILEVREIAAACTIKDSDLDVEVSTGDEFDSESFSSTGTFASGTDEEFDAKSFRSRYAFAFLESDDEAMVAQEHMANLNEAWFDREEDLQKEVHAGRLLPREGTNTELDGAYCGDDVLEQNSILSAWLMTTKKNKTKKKNRRGPRKGGEQEKPDEEAGGEQEKADEEANPQTCNGLASSPGFE